MDRETRSFVEMKVQPWKRLVFVRVSGNGWPAHRYWNLIAVRVLGTVLPMVDWWLHRTAVACSRELLGLIKGETAPGGAKRSCKVVARVLRMVEMRT